jgi:hypothetical protein
MRAAALKAREGIARAVEMLNSWTTGDDKTFQKNPFDESEEADKKRGTKVARGDTDDDSEMDNSSPVKKQKTVNSTDQENWKNDVEGYTDAESDDSDDELAQMMYDAGCVCSADQPERRKKELQHRREQRMQHSDAPMYISRRLSYHMHEQKKHDDTELSPMKGRILAFPKNIRLTVSVRPVVEE